MSGLLDKMKKIEAGWEGENSGASVGEEKAVETSKSQVEESLERISSGSRLSSSSEHEEKDSSAVEDEKAEVAEVSEDVKEQEVSAVEEAKERKSEEAPGKKASTKGKSPQNFKVGGKKTTVKKKGGASKPKGNGIANADKLQAIVDQKKKSAKGCPKQSKLHKHLNTVGEDGVSHKDRIEKELEEHAKKVKKVIYISCGAILGLLLLVMFIAFLKNGKKAGAAHGSVAKIKVKAAAYDTFAKEMWAYVKKESFEKETFHKDFDTFIKQYPADKAKAEKLKARLMRLYNISE